MWIAHLIGSGEREKIPNAIHSAMLLSILLGLLLGIIGQWLAKPLLLLIHTPSDIQTAAIQYLKLYFAGIPFLFLYDFAAAILRANGDSKRPLAALLLAGVLNVFLNLFFVIVCHLSVIGVALATDLATAVSACFVVDWLMHEPDVFQFSFRKLRLHSLDCKKILQIGIPAALQGAVFCIANIFIQSSINTFGSKAAAGSAIAMNFEYIAYYVNTAFGQTATTFISQNEAAKQFKRCKKIFTVCLCLLPLSAPVSSSSPLYSFANKRLVCSPPLRMKYNMHANESGSFFVCSRFAAYTKFRHGRCEVSVIPLFRQQKLCLESVPFEFSGYSPYLRTHKH